MRKQVVMKVCGAVIASTFITVVFGNGCAESFVSDGSSDAPIVGSAAAVTDTTDNNGIIPGTKTASLVSSNEVLSHLSTCAGVAQPSDRSVQMYESKKGAISVSGSASTITSPMLMAVANIAGEVCNDLIEQEVASSRRIFVNVDFSANVIPDASVLSDSISRMALSCWSRRETSSERAMILDMISGSIGSTETMAARKASLMLCTAMLSSLDSLLN